MKPYPEPRIMIETLDIAKQAVDIASEKQASDVILLDVRERANFTDYFVILSVESIPQMRAVHEDLMRDLKKAGAQLHHTEGTPMSGWILQDYGDIIIHIFAPEERSYYQLESSWIHGTTLIRIQ